jgi:putative ABC transport system ATP-binding protein
VPEPNLAVERVSVSYGPRNGRVRALNDVSLEFGRGELTLVMGPAGSGKTTLLSLLGCLLSPDQGSVFVEGVNVSRLRESERTGLRSRIGFIFQSFRLFHSLPAIENVMLSAEMSGKRRVYAEAARRLLTNVGLGKKQHLKPDALSGGEKQKVAVCRALLANPSIILADEPTASLDYDSGQQIRQMLNEISQDKERTVVVVSHDPRWKEHAHRVVVMEDGRIIDDTCRPDTRSLKCEESSYSYQPAQV